MPKRPAFFLPTLLLALLSAGCGFGTRYVFSSSSDLLATPADAGLPYREFWFPAADGVRLNGWLIPGDPEQPIVLFFHGNAANISHRVPNLRHLHEMGFSAFIFDYRGFGLSEGRPLSEDDLQRDAQGALELLRRLGWETSRMIYFGRSMGAAVALQLALQTPPAGLVLEAPFTSLHQIARHLTPYTYYSVGWWSMGQDFDNLGRIDQVRVPLLIFHGDQDRIVPLRMSLQLLARAPEPKTLHIVHGGGHSDAYLAGGEEYRMAWRQFAAGIFSQSK